MAHPAPGTRISIRLAGAPEEMLSFLDEFTAESDRAAAVLAGVLLDRQLGQLISGLLPEDTGKAQRVMQRSFRSFGSRVTAAFSLGLITASEHDDLDRVREVRNRFAHHLHGLTFDNPEVRAFCAAFECVPEFWARYDFGFALDTLSPRNRFAVATSLLAYYLHVRIARVQRLTPARPPLWPPT